MSAVRMPTAVMHCCTASAPNSGPLSERMWIGMQRRMNQSMSVLVTSMEESVLRTRKARLLRLNSFRTLSMWSAMIEVIGPSMVGKSARSVRNRAQEASLS